MALLVGLPTLFEKIYKRCGFFMGLFLKGGSTPKTNIVSQKKELLPAPFSSFPFRRAYIVEEVIVEVVFVNKQLTLSRTLSIKIRSYFFSKESS
jgi:hypothetical protein